jgi:hypothetical protein
MMLHPVRNRPRLSSIRVSTAIKRWLDVLKAWRNGHITLLLSLAVLALLSISHAFASARAHRIVDQPKAITDIAISTNEPDKPFTIFVSDERSGAIYSFTPPPASATLAELQLSQFAVFFQSPELSAPSGLTFSNGKLFICDREHPSLVQIDTTTKSFSVLIKAGGPLHNPGGIAVSAGGRIAVRDSNNDVVFYDQATGSTTQWHSERPLSRIEYVDEDLVVLTNEGDLLLVRTKPIESGIGLDATPIQLPTTVSTDIGHIVDFAYLNGTYYLIGESQIDAFVRSKGIAIRVLSKAMESASLYRARVNKQQIILVDAHGPVIWQVDRPVPTAATFVNNQTSLQSILSLYRYLADQGTLPVREFVASRDYNSTTELLRDLKILFTAPPPGSVDPVTSLICKLNESTCQPPSAASLSANQPVHKGQRLFLPDVSFKEIVGYESRTLTGLTVRDYLSKSFSQTPQIESRFSPDLLWSLNELTKSETIEIQLEAKVPGAVVATPARRNSAPGTILKINSDQDTVAGSFGACGIPYWQLPPRSFNLAARIKNSISGKSALSQLPRTVVNATSRKRLKQLDVDRVEYELDNATVEQSDKKAITAFLSQLPEPIATPVASPQPGASPEPKTCLQELTGASNYLVIDSVKVKTGRYSLYKEQSLIHLTKNQIKELGLLGEPDPTGTWSIVVGQPYYVAYRLSPWTTQALQAASIKLVPNPWTIKPSSSQDVYGLKDVTLLLPYVEQWQLIFLVKESELTSVSSEFNKLKNNYRFTALRAEESTRTRAAVTAYRSEPDDDIPLDVVTKNREALKAEIHYPTAIDQTEVKIGIGEKPCDVDQLHPDFIDVGGETAWIIDPNSVTSTDRCMHSAGTPRRVKRAIDVTDADHGTHVAGLIGARSNSLAPGLMPSAKLFLVDSTSPSTINTAVQNAVNRDVFIFNFSFGLADDDADLHTQMRDTWSNRLFVVAVDNEGSDLVTTRKPPISWMEDLRNNMIGVGSSISAAGTEYVLGDWRSSGGKIARGSSYGKRYVQLVAPGHDIYSMVAGNAYGVDTGASQAAPQVSATAAMLFAEDIREPARLKARLIYTADWFEQFRGKVWGGFLNVNRAVWQPKRNVFVTQTAPNDFEAITLLDEVTPAILKVKRGKIYESNGETIIQGAGLDIELTSVLRITLLPNNLYRVVYLDRDPKHLDQKRLKIVLDAEISGKFPCKKLDQWDSQNFVPSQCSKYDHGLDATQILDYVGKVPESVTFEP